LVPFQRPGLVLSHAEIRDSMVALTLDDGPVEQVVPWVLDVLRSEEVPATFFFVGESMEKTPQSVQAILAAGHEVGNHTFYHHRMLPRRSWFLLPDSMQDDIESTDSLIRQFGGPAKVFFRPPYGTRSFGLTLYLAWTGRVTVMWDVGPDSDLARDSAAIVNDALQHTRPGSVVLLHVMTPSRDQSRRALPGLVVGLKARGFRFVTVSTLLEAARRNR
jgi:peptidoglycan/xylan/chitin deacetylase (PgdA/CDA1 family)